MIRKVLIAVALAAGGALVAGGCAQTPVANAQADQMAKGFPPPESGKGALYVYRSGLMGFTRPIDVAIVGGASAQLAYNNYIRLEGPPGPIEIDCKVGDQTGGGQVEIGAGRTRYVEVSMKVTALLPSCQIAEMPPEQGRRAVLNGRRVDVQ